MIAGDHGSASRHRTIITAGVVAAFAVVYGGVLTGLVHGARYLRGNGAQRYRALATQRYAARRDPRRQN